MMARLARRVDKVFNDQEGHLLSRMGTARIETISNMYKEEKTGTKEQDLIDTPNRDRGSTLSLGRRRDGEHERVWMKRETGRITRTQCAGKIQNRGLDGCWKRDPSDGQFGRCVRRVEREPGYAH
jgi:hypothetical protein